MSNDPIGTISYTNSGPSELENNIPRILVVDDDRTMLMMLESKLEAQGYEVLTARNGKEACSILSTEYHKLNAVLLDREMPEMDGMKVIKWIKKNPDYSNLPIIMQTGADRPEQIKEGIDAGVFYYLTKPIEDEVLKSVLDAATREAEQQQLLRIAMKRHDASFHLRNNSNYTLYTLQEAEDLTCFLANCFPNPEITLTGIAELLINAIEHGNLGISYDEKTKLIAQGKWKDEIKSRQESDAYRDKKVNVSFKRTNSAYMVKIFDEGVGFNWKDFMTVNPSRVSDNHGRGIAQANMTSFDKIKYNDKGNEVTATVYTKNNEKN